MYQFQFDNLTAFVAMGGHGPYVWAAYGVGLLVMAWLVIRPMLQKRRFLTRFPRSREQSDIAVNSAGKVSATAKVSTTAKEGKEVS